MKLKSKERMENNSKILMFSLIFVFSFMVILIPLVSKGTRSDDVIEEQNDSLSLDCVESVLGNDEFECVVTLDSNSIVTQGIVIKYVLPDDVSHVSFDSDVFEIQSSEKDGVVLANLDGVSGEGIVVGNLKLKMSQDVISDSRYKIELVDSTIGDGEDTVVELDDTFDEVRIKSDVNTLESITLSDGLLNEEFDKNTLKYTTTTDSEKITISAETTSEYATISGDVDVEKELHYGTNKLNIFVTSEDGSKKTYEVSVFRNYDFDTTMYVYNKIDNYIYVGNNIDSFLNNIEVEEGLEKVLDKDNELLIISYNDESLLEIDVLSIDFKNYLLSNNTLYVEKELEYDDFMNDVIYSKGLSFDVSSDKVKVLYDDNVLGIYDVITYSLNFDSSLSIDEENFYINDLELGTTISELLDKINVVGGTADIFKNSGDKKSSDDIIATGDVLRVYLNDNQMAQYQLSVLGDSNGDGKLSTIDLAQFRKHLVDWVNPKTGIEFELEGVYSNSFDLNNDGRISVTDLAIMRKKIVGVA